MLEPTTTKSESAASQNNRFLSSSSSQLGWQEVAAGSCYAAMLTSCCTVVICSQKRTFSFGIMRANYVRLPASCFEPPRCRLLCHLHVHCARCSILMIHSACWIVIQQIAKCSGLCSQASRWHWCWAYLSCLFSVPGSIGVLFWLWAVVAAPQPSPRRWNNAPVLQRSHQLFCYDSGMGQYL